MKIRISFSVKVLLPYFLLAAFFLLIFLSEAAKEYPWVSVLAASGVALSVLLAAIQISWLRRPLYRIRSLILSLTRGTLPDYKASGSRDEIGDLEQHLEKHVKNLQSLSHFVSGIASGDFSGSLEKRSAEDEMGASLLSLKDSLMASQREAESRQRQEADRTWTAQGLAKFSKLFREVSDDLGELALELTRELVDYTEADVGALFLTSEGEDGSPLLELAGSYAFDRQKHIEKTFEFGEGLVGRAAMERELILITDLPPETIKIRSGLGEDLPSCLLLLPVLLDHTVLGVIELASLGNIPPHQVEFLQQVSDALATTLAKIKANLQTREQAEAHREFSMREEELLREIERLRKS